MMEIKPQTSLTFHGVNILSVHFRSERLYQEGEGVPVDVELDPKVFYPSHQPDNFTVLMEVRLAAKDFFELNVMASGDFSLDGNVGRDLRKTFANANALAIMFPYLRAFVASFTANVGGRLTTLNIPPHFFHGELEVMKEEFA